MEADLAAEMLIDLLRSAWIIESARASVYRRWSAHRPGFAEPEAASRERAEIIGESLTAHGGRTDDALVEPHADWMRSLAGNWTPDAAFADIFLVRLGDWVDAHAGPFLESDGRLTELGDVLRASIRLPESLPPAPPFEPLAPVAVEPPGPVEFSFGILGDLHIGSPAGEAMAKAAIDGLNSAGIDLVVQLGDITDHGDRDEFILAGRLLGELEMPVTTMMGNHDVFSYQEERLAGREYYPESFGRDPDGALLEHKGWRFAVLDSAEHGASPFAPFSLLSGQFTEGKGGAVVRGSLTSAQHDLLAEVAAPGGAPVFVFLHHPPQPFTSFPPVLFGLRDLDSGRLHATCDSGNVWGLFAGHTHRNALTRTFGTVPAQEVAIPRDFPYGYALVDVSQSGYAYRFVQLHDEELLRTASQTAGEIHRRYGLGQDHERGFVWTRPGN